MTKTDAIDYLGLLDGVRGETVQVQNLAVIEFAEDRGYWSADLRVDGAVEHARAISAGEAPFDEYGFDDIDGDIAAASVGAIEYLNDEGLLPEGYGYDPARPLDGFGQDETARGGGE